MLWDFPSWLLRFNLSEVLGASAYTLMFALLESVLIAIPLILLAYIYVKIQDDDGVLLFIAGVFATSLVIALALHLNDALWARKSLLALTWIFGLAASWFFARIFHSFADPLNSLLGRLALLISVYLIVDIFAIVIVIGRNL